MNYEYFMSDLKDLVANPKDAYRRIINYDSSVTGVVFLFVAGLIMGIKRYWGANIHLERLGDIAVEYAPQAIGHRDAELVMAFITPFFLIFMWYALTFAFDFMADKLGAMRGDIKDLKVALGYLAFFILIYEMFSFLFFAMGVVAGIQLFYTLGVVFLAVFWIWLIYMLVVALEVIYEMPMSYCVIDVLVVTAFALLFYYIFYEFLLGNLFLTSTFSKRVM